jgi:hypothetical protein
MAAASDAPEGDSHPASVRAASRSRWASSASSWLRAQIRSPSPLRQVLLSGTAR